MLIPPQKLSPLLQVLQYHSDGLEIRVPIAWSCFLTKLLRRYISAYAAIAAFRFLLSRVF
jgi:hypothetical protein